jgi:hypothetical protein
VLTPGRAVILVGPNGVEVSALPFYYSTGKGLVAELYLQDGTRLTCASEETAYVADGSNDGSRYYLKTSSA